MVARLPGRLSARRVETEKRPGRYADGGGLYLQVQASADGKSVTRSWLFRYTLNGRAREMGLGPTHTVPLASYTVTVREERREIRGARDLAADARRLLLSGIDPLEERRSREARQRSHQARSITFRRCAEEYIAAHGKKWANPKHAAQWESTLSTYCYPIIGQLPVSAVDKALVLKVLNPIWHTKPETASRLRGRIEAILSYATAADYRDGDNPARWRGYLEKLLLKRQDVAPTVNHAALAFSEIGEFVRALRELRARETEERGEAIGPSALEFLILTAARTGEVIGARPAEFDLAGRAWTIPAERMKTREPHRVPLCQDAIAIVEPALARRKPFVFPGRTKGGLSNMALLRVLDRMGHKEITVHGFRSTFRTWAGERTNFPREVIEMALAHKVKGKVEEAYWRGDVFDKRRKLMEAWAQYLREPVASVHSIHEGRARRGRGADSAQ